VDRRSGGAIVVAISAPRLPFQPSLGPGEIVQRSRALQNLIAFGSTRQQAGLAKFGAGGVAISAGTSEKQQVAHGDPSFVGTHDRPDRMNVT